MIRPRVDPCLFWNLKLLPSSNYSSETTTRLALDSLNTRRHLSLGNSELRLVQSQIYSQMRGVFLVSYADLNLYRTISHDMN